jgi:hypothetical protein
MMMTTFHTEQVENVFPKFLMGSGAGMNLAAMVILVPAYI